MSTESSVEALLFEEIRKEEVFFRRVLSRQGYVSDHDGVRISSMAFADRKFEPSIDRLKIIERLALGGAEFTQQSPENGVLRLTAGDIRGVEFSHSPPKSPETQYTANVHPDPIKDAPKNLAHCVVRARPAPNKKTIFKKLAERLARLAEWEILPPELKEQKSLHS